MPQNPNGLPSHSSTLSPTPWGFSTVLLSFLLGFVAAPLAAVWLIQQSSPGSPQWLRLLVVQGFSYLVWVLLFLRLSNKHGPVTWRILGLSMGQNLLATVGAGFLCGLGILLVGVLLGSLSKQFGWPADDPFKAFPTEQFRLITIFAVLVAPFFEELIFRGFLQATLYRYLSPFLAILLTTVIFTAFHSIYYAYWVALLYVMMLGLLLGWARYATGSIIPGAIGHFINNLLAAIILLGNANN